MDYKEIAAKAEELGFDVQVWRPAGRRQFQFVYGGRVRKFCPTVSDARTYIEGVIQGLEIGLTGGKA